HLHAAVLAGERRHAAPLLQLSARVPMAQRPLHGWSQHSHRGADAHGGVPDRRRVRGQARPRQSVEVTELRMAEPHPAAQAQLGGGTCLRAHALRLPPSPGAIMSEVPELREWFEDTDKQRHAAQLGMWIFLTSEFLLFGALFGLYTAYRVIYSEGFAAA